MCEQNSLNIIALPICFANIMMTITFSSDNVHACMQNSLLFYSTAEGKSFNEEKGFTYKIQCITKHSY